MDRFVNKKIEKQTIYEIYRACRLCGAGGGYKMPIIQNVVNLEGCDVELKQKIRECVQIEVHQDDKMPPLICELCVDKVNDFYEFLEMCKQTNKRTRLKLGLPPQMLPRGAPDAGDCILGVTEPIYVNDEDSNEPLSEKKGKAKGGKVKKEPEKKFKEVRIKLEDKISPRESRSTRLRPSSPPRLRGDRRPYADSEELSKLQSKVRRPQTPPPKSILKKGTVKMPDPPVQTPSTRFKRSREVDNVKHEVPNKRVKISLRASSVKNQKAPAGSPRQRRVEAEKKLARQREAEKQTRELQTPCEVCGGIYKTPQAMISHRRSHVVTFTNPKLACNPCALWFASAEETDAHHKRHRRHALKYRCGRCARAHVSLQAYEEHLEKTGCLRFEEVPDVKCATCWKMFPTQNLLDRHRCPGVGARPAKCTKCGKCWQSRKSLANHTKYCKKGDVNIDPELRARLKPIQVRVARCNPLLTNMKGDHYDVSAVSNNFGLDKSCVYPYISSGLRIKSELSDCMVKINDFDFGSYLHWDSDDESGESEAENLDVCRFAKKRKVESLAAWSLKTIFSSKFLGKVPRKFRRVKIESIVNSALNDSLSDLNINAVVSLKDVVNIDDKLNESDKNVEGTEDYDDLFRKVNSDEVVTNDDFDSLLSDRNDKTNTSYGSEESASVVDDKLVEENSDKSKSGVSGAKEELGAENNGIKSILTNGSHEKDIVKETSSNSEKALSQNRESNKKNDLQEKVLLNPELNNDEARSVGVDGETKVNNCLDINLNHNKIENMPSNETYQEGNTQNSEESLRNHESELACVNTNNKPLKNNDGSHMESHKETRNTLERLEITTEDSSAIDENETPAKRSSETLEESETARIKADTENKSKDIKESSQENDENICETSITEHKPSNSLRVNDVIENSVNGNASIDEENFNMDDLEDFSDTELEDCKLMVELDEQIGEQSRELIESKIDVDKEVEKEKTMEIENVTVNKELEVSGNGRDSTRELLKNKNIEVSEKSMKEKEGNEADTDLRQDKITLEDLLPKEDAKSMDLDSISDDEFEFND